ncbi:MAG: TIGR04372 family glycosyltransferase [Microcoleus sp. PH2017_10_PVI_O_A]|uniref:TIGR04372 family glycosyltransferase n=1 Tax=unclassified Microcoleus TaxID=2642155 RepID=UPI001DF22CF6|nr:MULTISPECIES: TIGR04372 family glycosyltransferase [unclassified Microcoleus]TAE80557.1 MAG: TIGR04372 family glycosyltransferase [Oscillatoriales cyanobacterium]MCC3405798.1 TIGR04372 family glycosyltransferase [Microcoleus sp. PH2017_10_PVI_O_A]MCC3459897.1 TIGR04372 family glycosyltransferase [Microcoleus sp. PH2017_11_PCY_U_A]MCC3478303.1 TIGR04372 family glycosyltransferase [Microcoleus sp. PH2017_12_PCY_D_A]MCC3559264.1 TIGR04372 family glycosyltransferase [Microcoleus sp. PH2017_27_L
MNQEFLQKNLSFQIANKLKHEGKYEEAIGYYQDAINENENNYWHYHNLGECWEKIGRFEEAVNCYDRALALHPKSAWTRHNLGDIWLKMGDLSRAIVEYHSASVLNPDFYGFHKKLGESLYKLAREVTLENLGESLQTYSKLAENIRSIGQNAESINQISYVGNEGFLETSSQQSDADFIQKVYLTYLKREPDPDGKKHFLQYLRQGTERRQIVAEIQESPECKSLIIFLIKSAYLQEAIAAYRHLTALKPNYYKYSELLGEALTHWGKALEERGRTDEAIDIYQQAIGYCHSLANAHYDRGSLLAQEGRFAEALESYQKAMSLRPDWQEAYYLKGIALDELDRHDEAIACWERMFEIEPDWLQAYIIIGARFCLRGQSEQWRNMLVRAHQVQQKLARSHDLDRLNVRFLSNIWTAAIGHIALIDWHLKMQALGWLSPHRRQLLLKPNQHIANPHFLNYWRPYIEMVSEPEIQEQCSNNARYLEESLYSVTLANGETMLYTEAGAAVQKQWELEGRSPLLSLSDSDREAGWRCLQSLGVPRNAWFVCLHVREDGFNGGYHQGLKCQKYRNADINTYLLAIESIVARGGWVIRVGDTTMQPLPAMKQIIDYACTDVKSDWMDVFLCAECRFFIGTSSGLCFVPSIFGVPCALTNWVPLGAFRSWYSQNILIPKLYFSESKQRLLTFAELIPPPVGHVFSTQVLADMGITVVDNTAEEINDVVVEMLERLEGKVEYAKADEDLQNQFATLADSYKCYGSSRMGMNFLRKYAGLLPARGDRA